jgi:hypothetical protein
VESPPIDAHDDVGVRDEWVGELEVPDVLESRFRHERVSGDCST